MKKRVFIIGSGISGLAVAHELTRQYAKKFDIHVFDKNSIVGGRARSVRCVDDYPGEHAMRVLLASYSTLFRTMQEIPYGRKGSTFDNLTYGHFAFRNGKEQLRFETKAESVYEHIKSCLQLVAFFNDQGISYTELLDFLQKISSVLIATEEEKDRLASISFEDFMIANEKSEAFKRLIFRLPEILVAAKKESSALLVSLVVLEFFVGPFLTSEFRRKGFASLNGPTSERFIDPWRELLERKGVKFKLNQRVSSLDFQQNRVSHD